MWFLYNGVELAGQFPLRYLAMKQFEELSANVLKCRKFLQIVAGIPPGRGSIERQCELRNLDASTSATVRRCVKRLACQVDRKARMWDSASGPSIYRGYGYGMVSKSGFSGNVGKGLCSGWLTSGGLGGCSGVNAHVRLRVWCQ